MIHENIELTGSFIVSGSFVLPSHPNTGSVSRTTGSMYHDTTDNILKVYTGNAWVIVGEQTASAAGGGGAGTDIEYLLVAGGGGGGRGSTGGSPANGGAGGAGGYLSSSLSSVQSGSSFTVTVGAGGSGGSGNTNPGVQGSDSSIAGSTITTITAVGGGFGAQGTSGATAGDGGSGGGGSNAASSGGSSTVGQGFDGGAGISDVQGGGGGGASEAGNTDGDRQGGDGKASSITGTSVTRAGGGSGGTYAGSATPGGDGGGGASGAGSGNAQDGTANTGGGGGGSGMNASGVCGNGGAGGSGVAIFAYNSGSLSGLGGVKSSRSDGYVVHTFNSSGTLTIGGPNDNPIIPQNNFNIVTWTNAVGQNQSPITGVGFQSDLVWVKLTNAGTNHVLTDSVRGVTKTLESNTLDAEETVAQGLTAFNSDGFALGNDVRFNSDERSAVAWCWKAGGAAVSNTDGTITSQVSANQAAGFSIVTWTGTQTNGSIGHGLSSPVELILVKDTDTAYNWYVFSKPSGASNNLRFEGLNTTSAATTQNSQFTTTSTLIENLSTYASLNTTGATMLAYCFHSVPGYQKIGSYTGNGSSSGQTITGLGFNPKFLLVKNATNAAGWRITDKVRGDNIFLYPNSSSANDSNSGYISLITDGFRMNGLDSNSVDTYIYLAIAE